MNPFFAPERYVTPDFVLRSYLPGDGAKLADALGSSYDHLVPFMPQMILNQTVEECEARIRGFRAKYLSNEEFTLGIFAPDESELWGGSGFYLREGRLESGKSEIGMWVRASQAGKGLGTRVLQALVDWGFTEWHWRRLVWKCDVDNLPSRRTAERVGFTLEATLRHHLPNFRTEGKSDAHYFALLKSEWAQMKQALP